MPPRKKKKGGFTGTHAAAIAIFAFAFAALAGFGYLYFSGPKAPQLVKSTLCPVDGPRSITAILVDTTDDLSETTRRQVSKLLENEAERLPAYALLEIRTLDPAGRNAGVIFSHCNPGDGHGLSDWTANPALARKRWLAGFRQPVMEALQNGLKAAASDNSPIMAAIQRMAIDHFTDAKAATLTKRLIVVSDMIENNLDYSQYKGDLSFQRYKATQSFRKFSTDLHGADVTIYYVQRQTRKKIDELAHAKFWQEWIKANNGKFESITRLQGMD